MGRTTDSRGSSVPRVAELFRRLAPHRLLGSDNAVTVQVVRRKLGSRCFRPTAGEFSHHDLSVAVGIVLDEPVGHPLGEAFRRSEEAVAFLFRRGRCLFPRPFFAICRRTAYARRAWGRGTRHAGGSDRGRRNRFTLDRLVLSLRDPNAQFFAAKLAVLVQIRVFWWIV